MGLGAPHGEPSEALSPELALVDARLAAWARTRLPDPPDALAPRPVTKNVAPVSDFSRIEPPDIPPWELPGRFGPRRLVLAVGAALVVATALLLADVEVEFGKTPAAAQEPAIPLTRTPEPDVTVKRPPTRSAPPRSASPPASSSPVAAPRRFAWAPLDGAVRYHVELFRGRARVFAADTRRPEIEIPARWTHAGRRQALRPGSYRWYVWPVAPDGRAARAVVQAKLIVPGP